MRSPTSSEGSRLIRIIVVPRAQTRMPGPRVIETHSQANGHHFNRPAQQATEARVKRDERSVLCHSLVVDSTFEQSENVTIRTAALGLQ